MGKKLTAADFKKILTNAGLPFDIYKYDGILNEIALYSRAYAQEQAEKGYTYAADHYKTIGDKVYEALYKRGYYDYYEEDD